jgi:hypothetical protein
MLAVEAEEQLQDRRQEAEVARVLELARREMAPPLAGALQLQTEALEVAALLVVEVRTLAGMALAA